MKTVKYLANRLRCACVYYACTQILVSLLFQLLAQNDSQAKFMPVSVMLYILLFSLCLSFAQELFKLKVSLTARILLHAIAYLVSVFLLFLLITQGLNNVSQLIFIILGAFILYVILGGIILLVYSLYNKNKVEKAGYVSQFTGKKKN